MKPVMAVYDVDPFYAHRLAEFANQTECTPFMAVAFTSLGRLKSYMEKQSVELLLISEGVKREEFEAVCPEQMIRLGESGTKQEQEDMVYKYQPSDQLFREVMACYQERAEPEAEACLTGTGRVIGVYSPIKRCGKTSFALTLGQILAREEKTLFVTLEDYSGFSQLMGETRGGGLSDLIYQYRQGKGMFVKIHAVLHRVEELDYIPPVTYGEDLTQISGEEMVKMLDQIIGAGGYKAVVLDLGQPIQGTEALLKRCGVIYVPVKEDRISKAKLEEWKADLLASDREQLYERMKFLELPQQRVGDLEHYFQQLLWGDMGDYIRGMLKGQDVQWMM